MSHVHSMFRGTTWLLLTLCVALSGCASKEEPARQAIASIEAAVAAAGADAQQYIPDALKAVTDQLADLKAKFDKKDYAAVIAAAPALLTQAQGLVATKDTAVREATARAAAEQQAAQRAAEAALQSNWDTLAVAVPDAIAAVESRVTMLAKSKKLPPNVTKDALASAQTGVADAKSLWEQAAGAQSGGNISDAVELAEQAKAKVDAALTSLGMSG